MPSPAKAALAILVGVAGCAKPGEPTLTPGHFVVSSVHGRICYVTIEMGREGGTLNRPDCDQIFFNAIQQTNILLTNNICVGEGCPEFRAGTAFP